MELKLSPTDLISLVNQTLDSAYNAVFLEGEVASFKINQGKWVFFDVKDEESSVSCFMSLYQLRIPIEDGMKVILKGTPKLTRWGKFSFTVQAVQPVGEGSLKKAYELLKKKLTKEGLFDQSKKRKIDPGVAKIGVISSTEAAGYADFIKIINARWSGIKVTVAHTKVQGLDAPDQIIRGLQFFNEKSDVDVVAIIRGGGSADDLAAFNDEKLVRAIASSKIPVITGIGHEVDESLADLAADKRASTPSNAAELLTKDKKNETRRLKESIMNAKNQLLIRVETEKQNIFNKIIQISDSLILKYISPAMENNKNIIRQISQKIKEKYHELESRLRQKIKILELLNPEKVLSQGYAIISGKLSPGEKIDIITIKYNIKAKIEEIDEREKES